MIPIINNSVDRKGTFYGNPNGFCGLPAGSLFRRINYTYDVFVLGRWSKYSDFYYEPKPREFENDDYESLWIKTTPSGNRSGWIQLPTVRKREYRTPFPYSLVYSDNNSLYNFDVLMGDIIISTGVVNDYQSTITIKNNSNTNLVINNITIENQDPSASIVTFGESTPYNLPSKDSINFESSTFKDYIINTLQTSSYSSNIIIDAQLDGIQNNFNFVIKPVFAVEILKVGDDILLSNNIDVDGKYFVVNHDSLSTNTKISTDYYISDNLLVF